MASIWSYKITFPSQDAYPYLQGLFAMKATNSSDSSVQSPVIQASPVEGWSLFLPQLSFMNLLLLSALLYVKLILHASFFFISRLLTFSWSLNLGTDRNHILVYHAPHVIEDFLCPRALKYGAGKIHTRAYCHFRRRCWDFPVMFLHGLCRIWFHFFYGMLHNLERMLW